MYNSQLSPQKTNKNTSRFLGYAIIFGTFFGVILGNINKYQVLSIVSSIIIFMIFAYFFGKNEDKKINNQLDKIAYAIKKSSYNKEKNLVEVTIVDKRDREKIINLDKKTYQKMQLKKYELVYLKENGKVTPAYSHTKEKKHKSLLDIVNEYQKLKEEDNKN